MKKQKIKKSVAKRFKVTKTGKVLYKHQQLGHLKRKKNQRQLRRLKETGHLEGAFANKVKKMLGKK